MDAPSAAELLDRDAWTFVASLMVTIEIPGYPGAGHIHFFDSTKGFGWASVAIMVAYIESGVMVHSIILHDKEQSLDELINQAAIEVGIRLGDHMGWPSHPTMETRQRSPSTEAEEVVRGELSRIAEEIPLLVQYKIDLKDKE